jgi:hypothetical protein
VKPICEQKSHIGHSQKVSKGVNAICIEMDRVRRILCKSRASSVARLSLHGKCEKKPFQQWSEVIEDADGKYQENMSREIMNAGQFTFQAVRHTALS